LTILALQLEENGFPFFRTFRALTPCKTGELLKSSFKFSDRV
jgi:hypothetical protein